MENQYTASQIVRMLQLDVQVQTLTKAEAAGRIPSAHRVKRGKLSARLWGTDTIPDIARVFGAFRRPKECKVIATYINKGGVGKSTWTFNLSRILALNGLKVLVIGTDFQCSISKAFGSDYSSGEWPYTILDCMAGDGKIEQNIIATDIPNLAYVPESPELSIAERVLSRHVRREYRMNDLIRPLREKFDVIIIDCAPSWTEMSNNALVAADAIVAPILMDDECYYSFKIFMRELGRFTESMGGKEYDFIKFLPNNVARTKFSKSYYRLFIEDYSDLFLTSNIRGSVSIQEAMSSRRSIAEYDPKSPAAVDVYEAIHEVYENIMEVTGGA